MRRYLTAVAALAGVGVLIWLVVESGPARLVGHLWALGSLFPLIMALTGGRYVLQAAGWRAAIEPRDRPAWTELMKGVVAGEAAGYLTWGPIAREPVKAVFLGARLPAQVGLAAALPERMASLTASTTLVLVALGFVAARHAVLTWLTAVAAALALVLTHASRRRDLPPPPQPAPAAVQSVLRTARKEKSGVARRGRKTVVAMFEVFRDLWLRRRSVLLAIIGVGMAQELINVVEAYLLLTWLGAQPTVATTVVFEGAGRLLNVFGQFVPGKVGVSEAASTAVADTLRLGAAQGLSVALARRARSMLWGLIGIGLIGYQTYGSRQPARQTAVGLEHRPHAVTLV